MHAIKKYNDQLKKIDRVDNLELEIRKKITVDLFLEIYEQYKTKHGVFKSSFSRSDNNIREESFYVLGEKKEKECISKEKIHTELFNGFTLNISVEKPTEKSLTVIKYSRIKFRWSFDILPKWVMDLTINIELDGNRVVEMVKYYLINQKRTDPKELLEYINESSYMIQKPTIMNTDIEFEYSDNNPITQEDIDVLSVEISKMSGMVRQDDRVNDTIKAVSKILYPKMQPYTNIKELLYNPITLDRRTFLILKPSLSDYTVAPKNDGERTLILVTKTDKKTIILLNNELITLGDNTELSHKTVKYIIDAEVLLSEKKIYAFDLIYDGENLIDSYENGYLQRVAKLREIKDEISGIFNTLDKDYNFAINTIQKFSELTEKEFYQLANTKNTDGLIFTHYEDPKKVYKWKPLEQNTIDFLVIETDNDIIGKYGYEKNNKKPYILCSGINTNDRKVLGLDQHLFPFKTGNVGAELQYVPFISSLDKYSYIWYSDRTDLDMKICEFRLTFTENNKKQWQLVRERPDRDRLVKLGRYYGNYYKIAELTYMYYFNPILLSQFYEKDHNYFQVTKKDEYKTMIGLNNFVKENVLSQVKNTNYLIDLSCGKGQDIFRYNAFGVKNLLAVDRDADAISELVNRKYSLGVPEFYKYNRNKIQNLKHFIFIQARICDLSQSADTIIKTIEPETKAKFVTMNLAIHYILQNKKSLIEFSKFIDRLLDNGGTFIFSTFCGEKLITDFENYKKAGKPQKIEFADDKFNISRVSETQIEVLHPFSNEKYRENIVNITEVVEQFESLGFTLKQRVYFSEFITKYADSNKLTEDEKRYVDYYVYVSLTKD